MSNFSHVIEEESEGPHEVVEELDFYDVRDEEFSESNRIKVLDDELNVPLKIPSLSSSPTIQDCSRSNQNSSDVPDELIDQFGEEELMESYGDAAIAPPVDDVEKNLDKAIMCKEEGNDFFRSKQYDNAIEMYSQAINLCPENVEDENYEEHCNFFATFLGNRAAAFFALQEWDMAVDDCNWALDKKPDYVKVIVRRSQAFEKLNRIDEALVDAKRIQELDPTWPKIDVIIKRLQKTHDDKMEQMKDEAMGKLKELGNNILGNFGMSLDNFKFEQDPSTGAYSIGTKQ